MVNDNRSPTNNTWRRESDGFDSRRNSTYHHRREDSFESSSSNRDRDRDRRDWADRDRDRREWPDRDRDRDRDRGLGRDDRERKPFEKQPPPPPPPPPQKRLPNDDAERRGPAVPKGPRLLKALPTPSRTGTRLPHSPLKLSIAGSASPSTPKKDARDAVASCLVALLKKSRDVGGSEQAKQSLDRLDERREMLKKRSLSKNSDFASLPDLNRPLSDAEIEQREEADAQVLKKTNDLSSASKNFLAQLDSWLQPNAALAELVGTLKTKQDGMEAKLENQVDLRTLQEDNAKLQGQVKALAALVENLSTRVNTVESSSTKLVMQAGQFAARAITQAATMGALEAKVADHGAILAKVEAVDLESMNNFIVAEKPRQQDTLNKHEAAVAKLKTEMIAVQSGLQAAQAALQQDSSTKTAPASTPAPALATPQPTTAPPSAAALVFPGDDFTSLRIEISKLNERVLPIEKCSEKLEELETRQTRAMARNTIETNKLREELQKDRKGWNNAFKILGDLLDKETKNRLVDSGRLKELENLVQQLQSQPPPGAPPTTTAGLGQVTATVPSGDVEMAETDLGPFLSPVPEPANATDPVEPAELPAPAVPTGEEAVSQTRGPEDDYASHRALEIALEVLQERMKATEDEIRLTRRDFDSQCSAIRMMVSTLDSQFNNLTTKDLFQAIVGHMERLFPNARQVQEDVKHLAEQLARLKESSRATDATIKKVGDYVGLALAPKRPLTEGISNGGTDETSAAKRQRTNGSRPPEKGVVNGAASTSARSSPAAIARAGT